MCRCDFVCNLYASEQKEYSCKASLGVVTYHLTVDIHRGYDGIVFTIFHQLINESIDLLTN